MTTYADIPGVLARGGDIAVDAAEHLGAVFAAEQPRYFLLDLHHPDSALGWVVIERDPEVGEEGLDLGSVLVETLRSISGNHEHLSPLARCPKWPAQSTVRL
ncbi:MAG: hypothetical protein RL077_2442 [Verrucomicrobiota bacterium]